MKRLLILEDGSVYEGTAFGADHFQVGELVFNTGMSGYQEVLSDLSYCGQIVMMTYPMIGNYGINHDDLADGSGKAGLTFLTKNEAIGKYLMNADNTAVGGWEKGELRAKMNSGEIWNLMPSDFQSKVKPVRKLTNNVDGADKNAAITATTDKLFLLSYSEIVETPQISFGWSEYPWIGKEGTQYEAFRDKDINNNGDNDCLTLPARGEWWERSLHPQYSVFFGSVGNDGFPGNSNFAAGSSFVCPAWCF